VLAQDQRWFNRSETVGSLATNSLHFFERRLTTADASHENGVAESLNRRLLERVRAMLRQAN
jgi:hypothetical protein